MRSPGHHISEEIRHFFKATGYLVYRHPGPFFWIPIALSLFSILGGLRFHEENRIWYLYSPSGADSHYENAVANEFFNDRGGKFWLEIAITAQDMGNLLRQDYLDDAEALSNYLQYNLTVPCEPSIEADGECSFSDMCSGMCNDNQVIPIFNLIYRNASQRLHPNFRLTYPTMHLYNDEYYVGEHFAGVEISNTTNRISSVKVMMLYFRTDRKNAQVAETLTRWETQMFDFVEHFSHPHLNITCNSDYLIAKEVRKNGLTCVPFFAISVSLVFVFILISNRREHFTISHGIVMAALGVAGPLLAVLTAFGGLALLGVPFNSITLVMPFLIIGVGSDDVFIIIHACRKTDMRKGLEEQIAETMEEAGPSITVTSATNILSFAIGIMTPTPAISMFCLYTTVALFVDFIYQLTFFVAALVYEEKRQARLKTKEQEIEEFKKAAAAAALKAAPPAEKRGAVSIYCEWLKKWQIRLCILAVMLVYWAASLYGCINMQIKMDTTNLVLKDSPLMHTAWIYEKYLWSEGQLVLVFVNNPPDLRMPEGQQAMFDIVNRFETLPYSMGHNSTSFWLRSFLSQNLVPEGKEDRFYPLLKEWIGDEENGGSRWNDMLRTTHDKQGNITGVDKFMFATASAMGKDGSWATRKLLQANWRNAAKEFAQYNVSVFQAYAFYVDQLNSIGSNTISTVIVAAITMDLACFLMIPHASSIISSTVAMISINIGVFGLLSLWGVNLDPITMCTTLMSIGFSVDFTAHISYHYFRNPIEWASEERLADALKSIGWPMLQAGISTLTCVSPLMLIDSYMVGVFVKTIQIVISLGLVHGIVVLPALLLTVGRKQQIAPVTEKPAVQDVGMTAIALPSPKTKLEKRRSAMLEDGTVPSRDRG